MCGNNKLAHFDCVKEFLGSNPTSEHFFSGKRSPIYSNEGIGGKIVTQQCKISAFDWKIKPLNVLKFGENSFTDGATFHSNECGLMSEN